MVSLREKELRLIALRGAFAVMGKPTSEVALAPGMEILLARGLVLEVEAVHLPDAVMGLEGEGLARQILPGVASLVLGPELRLVRGFVEGAAAWVWRTGDAWRLRLGEQAALPLVLGQTFQVGTATLRAIEVPLAAAGQAPTRQQGAVDQPLKLLAKFDTVHIQQEGKGVAVLSGVPARIISELVALRGPVHWTVLVAQLWPREPDPEVQRSRLDVNLSRLRRKLRECQVRSDLVYTDGTGQIELLLYPHDQVEDCT